VDPRGAPQNNPVGFFFDPRDGSFVIGGLNLGSTRKFRNITTNPRVALVIDELVSTSPWRVRGLEIRGWAEALTDQEPPMPGFSRELIRIHPRHVFSWGVNPDTEGMTKRTAARPQPSRRSS
jgi:pyridoxamine 5'-phosphate oxidase family protein